MKLISTSPFLAILLLGIFVFAAHPSSEQRVDLTHWKSNQKILLLIENCQDGQLSSTICKSEAPRVLDDCKSLHVLACDDKRLEDILSVGTSKLEIR